MCAKRRIDPEIHNLSPTVKMRLNAAADFPDTTGPDFATHPGIQTPP